MIYPSDFAACVAHDCSVRLTCHRYLKALHMRDSDISVFVAVPEDKQGPECTERVEVTTGAGK